MKSVPVALVIAGFAALPAASAPARVATFDSLTSPTLAGRGWDTFANADGWTGGGAGIEIQNGIAGAALSGRNLVELDTYANSSMYRELAAGHYRVAYDYSPRPGQPEDTNGIDLLFDDQQLDGIAAAGGPDTDWFHRDIDFRTATGGRLTFAAVGRSDSLGGYLDNVWVEAVPEPATWGMMLAGFVMVGATSRHRTRRRVSA